MLVLVAVILFVLWFFGMITKFMLGGFIHLLLLLAVIAILIRLIQGRAAV